MLLAAQALYLSLCRDMRAPTSFYVCMSVCMFFFMSDYLFVLVCLCVYFM